MNRRYAQVMAGLFLLFIGLNAVSDGNFFGVMMGIGGFYMLARQFQEGQHNRRREGDYQRWRSQNSRVSYDFSGAERRSQQRSTPPAHEQHNPDKVYTHALEAAQQAGIDPSRAQVLPVDLGLFVYQDDSKPSVYRTRRLPKDSDYIQPFVQLRIPRAANGKVTFEIIDDLGETVFMRTETYELQRGRNLIVPTRRLPVHDALDMDEGRWSLRIEADGIIIAEHDFYWSEPVSDFVVDSLADDGEISHELQAALSESEISPMSLDDLLAHQDDDNRRAAR